jgi:phosphocarrier protein
LAARFPCDISIGRDGQFADAKSVMGVLLLCGAKGTKLTIKASGPEAAEAVKQLGELIENRFGETE